MYTLPYKSSLESKLQVFRLSVLHQFVPHNSRLFKMNLVQSESCDYCAYLDTIIDRFGECENIQSFWTQFQTWWKNCYPLFRGLSILGHGWTRN